MTHKPLLTKEQRLDIQLTHEEEHLEAWRRDTLGTLIKCLAGVKLTEKRYMEVFYDAGNSTLTGAVRAGEFRVNKLSKATEAVKIEWAKNLTWKDIVEEMIYHLRNNIFDAIAEMSQQNDEEDEDYDEYEDADDDEDDGRKFFLGIMRKLSVMYSIAVENERRKETNINQV